VSDQKSERPFALLFSQGVCMKNVRSWSVSAIAAVLLVACGGGDPDVPGTGSPAGAPTTKGTFSAVVSLKWASVRHR